MFQFLHKRTPTETNQAYANSTPVMEINFDINIMVISDTHGSLTKEKFLSQLANDTDVCILMGDISYQDIRLIQAFLDPAIPLYGILGNHDEWDVLDACNIKNIHGDVVIVQGVRIAGIQVSYRYKPSNQPLYTDEESLYISKTMAPAVVLISHDCPKYLYECKDVSRSGLLGITDYCSKQNVPLNLHGHHHINDSKTLNNGTISMGCYGIRHINTKQLSCI